ncbi:MAG: thioredoxin domain-containing protein [Chitinophagales bacterium]|nr:thioredoxin domain-containing protein [Chitinophagales bacterium]
MKTIQNLFLTAIFFSVTIAFAIVPGKKFVLDVPEFAQEIKNKDIQLLDVRTPKEFQEGHIVDATNFNWLGDYFKLQIGNLDKNKPVYVYCMSGKRSSAASEVLLAEGFEVHELTGGILNWRSREMPEVVEKPAKGGMSEEDFNALLNQAQPVLVDFYAPWCGPCKKMEPTLNKLSQEGQVKVLRINIDEHSNLAKTYKIFNIPLLKLYDKDQVIWQHEGYLDEVGIRKGISK